jgi:hypothetical protein
MARSFVGRFVKRTYQPVTIVLVEPTTSTTESQTPVAVPGTFDFSAALNSGLILLLEDI